jgi:hypothetical protein
MSQPAATTIPYSVQIRRFELHMLRLFGNLQKCWPSLFPTASCPEFRLLKINYFEKPSAEAAQSRDIVGTLRTTLRSPGWEIQ